MPENVLNHKDMAAKRSEGPKVAHKIGFEMVVEQSNSTEEVMTIRMLRPNLGIEKRETLKVVKGLCQSEITLSTQ